MPTKKEVVALLLTEEELAEVRALLAELQEARIVSRRWSVNRFLLSLSRLAAGRVRSALRRGQKIAPLP